ncbi:MAG: L,D-transpeptidase [Candidatus Pacebacteria bacterium]|nr:L,D-transpeptidase [Candidatus Paceibacterota bacterium]MBP9842601.1 L,D-transpeptidase [Candidatus Paceibacterota bacterium]
MASRTYKNRSSIFVLGTLIILLIIGLSVAIFSRLVADGVLTFFGVLSNDVVSVEYMEEPVITELVNEVIIPLNAVPFATGTLRYLEIVDSCEIGYSEDCLLVRSGPGKEFPIVGRLRKGIVLRSDESKEVDGVLWHRIIFDEWLRYPERIVGEWYVSGEYTEIFYDDGSLEYETDYATGTKQIIVDRSEQSLRAYDGEVLFMEVSISTGLELTPTPRGIFHIFRKTPSRYMQGPLPYLVDKQYYDLPGVPWNLYFTEGGAVIHGAYWHDSFGSPYSHGCVNLPPKEAKRLYGWAELGTGVVVQD